MKLVVAQMIEPTPNRASAPATADVPRKRRRPSRKLSPSLSYLRHFGLKAFPFGLTPDTGYFFPGGGAQSALNTLLVALESGEGLIKIVGEPGSGKTLLCRHLLNRLEKAGWAAAYVPNPHLAPEALQQALLEELEPYEVVSCAPGSETAPEPPPVGAKSFLGRPGERLESSAGIPAGSSRRSLTHALESRLLALAGDGLRAVALIDEAQAAPLETLEALRLITNLETEKRKLLQIVLFGQPELDARLADPAVRQIRSRITFQDTLIPLDASETPAYLMHRTRQAGATAPLFQPEAARKLHRLGRGSPRLINILAHKTLLLAYGEGCIEAQPRHVVLAGRDTPGARLGLFDRVWPR